MIAPPQLVPPAEWPEGWNRGPCEGWTAADYATAALLFLDAAGALAPATVDALAADAWKYAGFLSRRRRVPPFLTVP